MPPELIPDFWNGWGDPNTGSTYVHHYHAGTQYADLAQLAVHYIDAFSVDDTVRQQYDDAGAPIPVPDGSITQYGADVRFQLGGFGHLFLGASHIGAEFSSKVGYVMAPLNVSGGIGLLQYFGANSRGNGDLDVAGMQYDFSVGELSHHPAEFEGRSPDFRASLFGAYAHVNSEDRDFDDYHKVKGGVELTYIALPWFGVTGRVDHVVQDDRDRKLDMTVVSPKLLFRSDWRSREQITLQYATWFYGSHVRLRNDPLQKLDEHMLAIQGSMWW